MNIKEKVYQSLMSSPELKALLVKDRKDRCIYPGQSPNAGTYPILVYNVISDVQNMNQLHICGVGGTERVH